MKAIEWLFTRESNAWKSFPRVPDIDEPSGDVEAITAEYIAWVDAGCPQKAGEKFHPGRWITAIALGGTAIGEAACAVFGVETSPIAHLITDGIGILAVGGATLEVVASIEMSRIKGY